MRRLMTKLLACCLVFALALTMCAGAFSVSAASTGTLTVGEVTVNKGAATAVVPVVLATDSADGYAMATYTIVVPAALQTIADIAVACDSETNPAVVSYLDAEGNVVSVAAGANSATAPAIDAAGNINFKVDCTDITLAGPASITVNITFDVSAAAAATYAIAVAEVVAGDFNAEYVDVTADEGSVTVKQGAELDNTLKFYITGANVQDTLGVGCTIKKADYAYASYKVEFTATKYNADRDIYVEEPVLIDAAAVGANYFRALYPNIALFELDQPIVAVIKAYDAAGNYVAYSNNITLIPAELLKETYTKASASTATGVETKTLVADMLNLGAAAQSYFGIAAETANPDNDLLANFKSNPINKGWEENEYASTETVDSIASKLALIDGTGITWAENSPLTSSQISFAPSLNMAATPTMSFRVTDSKIAYSADDFTLDVSYNAVLPTAVAGEKTQSFTGADWSIAGSGKYKTAIFSKMTLADSNQTVTAKLYYKGDLVLTSEYTMDQGMQKLFANAKAKDLALALAEFGISARAYFS